MKGKVAADIDEYIDGFPDSTQKLLRQVREAVQKAAPAAVEAIKYGMPTFVLNGNLVHFAGYDHHIGFYPTPDGTDEFKKEISKYKTGKGSTQFPIDEPMPLTLISRMVRHRVKTNTAKAPKKK
ncbi:MAG: hypothetical protein EOO09_01125 [Chitinophagaceae bacterium]|nr:MAG: hypothetical protein EOO09_01125 [Chitinophagaceae bacterium]